jgi:ribonuclease HI
LFFTCTKLRHILLSVEIIVIWKSNVIKHMLMAPVLKGRLGKWMFALSKFNIQYQPVKADLITERINTNIATLSVRAWGMYLDGSACEDECGIGILLVSPQGVTYSFLVRLSAPCINNLAEYEVVRRGMELLLEAGVEEVEVFGDSKLVVSQLTEEYRCESKSLFPLWMHCRELITQFKYINFSWIPRSQNAEANDLAQKTLGYKATTHEADFLEQFLELGDWRADIFNYLKDPAQGGT